MYNDNVIDNINNSNDVDIAIEELRASLSSSNQITVNSLDHLASTISESSDKTLETIRSSSEEIKAVSEAINNLEVKLNAETIDATNQLAASVESIASTVFTMSDGVSLQTALFTVMVAFIGSGSAFLFSLLQTRHTRNKDRINNISNSLSKTISTLEDNAVRYWLNNSSDLSDNQALEMKIQSLLRESRSQSDLLSKVLKRKGVSFWVVEKFPLLGDIEIAKKLNDINVFQTVIYELVTGGDFEVSSRVKSKNTAQRISTQCSKIKSKVSYISNTQ
jgi:hypothetical protein